MSSTASVRTAPVSVSPAGTGATAPWRAARTCAATTASAGLTSTGPGAASVRPAGTGRTAPPGWRQPAVTARTMTEVGSFHQFHFVVNLGNMAHWHNYVDEVNSKMSRVGIGNH